MMVVSQNTAQTQVLQLLVSQLHSKTEKYTYKSYTFNDLVNIVSSGYTNVRCMVDTESDGVPD